MELILLVGLQASGKSTFYRTHFAQTHAYVSKDRLRNNKHPEQRQRQLLQELLSSGRSVVVDNTNPTPESRAPLIALGKESHAFVSGYYFETNVKRSLERNGQRVAKERVPNIGIFATLKRLTPPSSEEEFDMLYLVRSCDNFVFEVTDWHLPLKS